MIINIVVQYTPYIIVRSRHYGLKQSLNSALDTQLSRMGFVQTTSDPCLYASAGGVDKSIYVSCFLILNNVHTYIGNNVVFPYFSLQFVGKGFFNFSHSFVTLSCQQNIITIDCYDKCLAYTESVLQKFGMENKAVNTLIDIGTRLNDDCDDIAYVCSEHCGTL